MLQDIFNHALPDFAMGVGVIIGLLKVFDWLLLDSQKRQLKSFAESAWIWLSYQKAGKFFSLIASYKVQRGLFVSIQLVLIGYIFVAMAHELPGAGFNAVVRNVGNPRIYQFESWIDLAAIFLSAVLFCTIWKPEFARIFATADGLKEYFSVTSVFFFVFFLSYFLLVTLENGVFWCLTGSNLWQPDRWQIESRIGQTGAVIYFVFTAVINAPFITMLNFFFFLNLLSVFWVSLVSIMMGVLRLVQFFCIRVAESPNGPVLAISGLFVAIGAIVKAIIAKPH